MAVMPRPTLVALLMPSCCAGVLGRPGASVFARVYGADGGRGGGSPGGARLWGLIATTLGDQHLLLATVSIVLGFGVDVDGYCCFSVRGLLPHLCSYDGTNGGRCS